MRQTLQNQQKLWETIELQQNQNDALKKTVEFLLEQAKQQQLMIQQLQISDQQKNEIVFSKENLQRIKRLQSN